MTTSDGTRPILPAAVVARPHQLQALEALAGHDRATLVMETFLEMGWQCGRLGTHQFIDSGRSDVPAFIAALEQRSGSARGTD